MNGDITGLIIIVLMLMNVIQMFWIQKSVPIDRVDGLRSEMRKKATETPNKIDDLGMDIFDIFFEWYKNRDKNPEAGESAISDEKKV